MLDVYAVKVPDKIDRFLLNSLLNQVDRAKKERLLRFRREEDLMRGLFGDLLLRRIIMKKTGMNNKDISFTANEYGKPLLEGRDDVHFNLSHSGIWVVAAVDSNPVGIDVEQISDIDLGISEHFFSDDEHKDLMSKRDRLSYFFTLWTIKESYIKILGKGLSHPLNSFTIKFVTEDKIMLKCPEGNPIDGVSFARYNIHSDYKMVLCASHNRLPEDVVMQCPNQLIREFVGHA